MPVTAFGVWDKDVKLFIDDLCSGELSETFNKDELLKWFYEEGICAVQRQEQISFRKLLDLYNKRFGYLPKIEPTTILDIHFDAFQSLQQEFVKRFVGDSNTALLEIIAPKFLLFMNTTMENAQPFYKVQAEVATELNGMYNQNPGYTDHAAFTYVVERFNIHKLLSPSLNSEIDSHLKLMHEYRAFLFAKQITPAQSTLVRSPSQRNLFKLQSPKQEETTAPTLRPA